MADFKDRGDMVRAQLRKGLESARAVMDALLAGLWSIGGAALGMMRWTEGEEVAKSQLVG